MRLREGGRETEMGVVEVSTTLQPYTCVPLEKSNWEMSALRLLSARYWEERYRGGTGQGEGGECERGGLHHIEENQVSIPNQSTKITEQASTCDSHMIHT